MFIHRFLHILLEVSLCSTNPFIIIIIRKPHALHCLSKKSKTSNHLFLYQFNKKKKNLDRIR